MRRNEKEWVTKSTHLRLLELPKNLIRELNDFDQKIEQELEIPFSEILKKSKALKKSLHRSFIQARLSARFKETYQQASLNLKKAKNMNQSLEEFSENLVEKINLEFEEIDFLVFREFVRLLRACSLHIDFKISAIIKENFKKTFRTERIKLIINFVAKELAY